MTLSTEARQRYARHLVLPQVGEAGQEQLARAAVFIVGLGGRGSRGAL
jgi:molybdopterin/thiamine biosynthesis adenylyltransferase